MGNLARFVWRRGLLMLAFALVMALVAGPGAAQQPTVVFEPPGVCGDANSAFGTDCSLKELFDSVNPNTGDKNGTVAILDVPVDPPVHIVFDQFDIKNDLAIGTTATDFDRVAVEPRGLLTNAPGLNFIPLNTWNVAGGLVTGARHTTLDTIEFRVRAFDSQTNKSVARIKDVELGIPPSSVALSVDPNEPARIEVRERVRGGMPEVNLTTFLSHTAPTAPGLFTDEQLRDEATFAPQREVTVRKQVQLRPGGVAGNGVTLPLVFQDFSLTTGDEVGCLPEILERQGGGAQAVEFCALPAGEVFPFVSTLAAQKGGDTKLVTAGPSGFAPLTFHSVGTTGGLSVDKIFYLSALFPSPDANGNPVLLSDFETNNTGGLLLRKITFDAILFGPVLDEEVLVLDTDTGDVASIYKLDDPVTVGGVDYTIDGFAGGHITDSGRVYLNVDLLPVAGPAIPTDAILVIDTSQAFSGGGVLLVDDWLPFDTVQTAAGPVQLDTQIEVLDVDDLTDNLLIRSFRFGSSAPINAYVATGGSKNQVRRAARRGDPVPGTTDEIFLIDSGSVNEFGDAGVITRNAPAGTTTVTGSAALVSPGTGGLQSLLKTDDQLPGGSGLLVGGVSNVAISTGGKAAALATYFDAQARLTQALVPFDYGATGLATPGAPLITTGDILRDAGGLGRPVIISGFDPHGIDQNHAAVPISLPGAAAVLRIPLNAQVVAVPDVVGLLQAAAEADIVAACLTVGTVTTQASNTVLAGDVISQDPAAGTQVAPNSAVDLVVSSGPAQITVPDVVGLPQAFAEADIVAFGLVVGTVSTANSNTVPAGDVISQDPAAGSQAAQGSAVDLVVSSGPALLSVPDVAGLSQASAEAAIVAAGLTVGVVSTANSNIVPAGDVISQSPAAGTLVAPGGAVDLVVSSGPAPVVGDLDGDGDVDRNDLNVILAARNTPASGPGDPRDLDGDGVITVLDARKLTQLCTRPRCATQ